MISKIENYVIITSLKSETMGKLITRISGLCLLISSLPGKAMRMHVESLDKPRNVNKRSQSLAWKASRCQQAFSKPCLESLGMSTSVLKALPSKLDINRHSPTILYILPCGLTSSSLCFPIGLCPPKSGKLASC